MKHIKFSNAQPSNYNNTLYHTLRLNDIETPKRREHEQDFDLKDGSPKKYKHPDYETPSISSL